jgi:hypothetical protein
MLSSPLELGDSSGVRLPMVSFEVSFCSPLSEKRSESSADSLSSWDSLAVIGSSLWDVSLAQDKVPENRPRASIHLVEPWLSQATKADLSFDFIATKLLMDLRQQKIYLQEDRDNLMMALVLDLLRQGIFLKKVL